MSDNLRGAAWMCLAMLGYVVNDALVKWVAEELPLFQTIFLRAAAIIVLLTAIARVGGATAALPTFFTAPLVLRVMMETIGTVVYLLALTRVPLASLTAILQLVPIAVTFVAARLLRERVSPVRVGAVVAGFVGVILIIRPGGAEFSPWFMAGLVTVAIIVVREVATLNISTEIPGTLAALATAVTVGAMGLIVSLFDGWQQPPANRLLALGVAACFLSLGYVGSINAVRSGDISFSAPFRYTILVFAIVLQIVIFDDVPDLQTFVGAGVVTAAGLVALRAEHSRA